MNGVHPVYMPFTRHSFVQIYLTRMSLAAYLLIHISPSGLLRFEVPAKNDRKRSKADALLEEGTLNPAPEKVRDPKFQGSEFFDPRDAVQVKYEMLRRVSIDSASVTEVSDEYGFSRPTYYQAKANFDAAGITGLVPKRPGPRAPHKVHGEVLAFLQARLVPGEPVGGGGVAG